MLNTKGQKCKMFLIGLCALLLGAVLVIPFKSIWSCKNILAIELVVKIGVIPVLMLLLSICPNKLKYAQVSGYRNQSKVVSVMSYFPTFVYIVGVAAESLYLLAQGYVLNGGAPLGLSPWNMWFVALILFIVAVVTFFHFLPKFEMLLDVKEHVIFDIVIFVVLVCFCALFYLVLTSTHDLFLSVGPKGDPFLLTLYIVGLVFAGIELHNIAQLVARDEVNLHVKFNDLDASSYVSRMAEYNRAYNDIMDDFEEFFENEDDDYEIEDEEPEEAEEVQEPEEEQVQEEAQEEPQEEVQEEPQEEAEEEMSDEERETLEQIEKLESEVDELRQAKEEEEAAEAERLRQRELAAQEALEKALKNKEEMRPTFAELVAYAKSLEQVSMIENKEKQQVKFFIGKKVFLVMTDTEKDYRLQFNVNPANVVEWWQVNTEIRPRSNKTDNWYKLTNKGTFTKELLFDIILHARDFMVQQIADAEAQKQAAKEAAKAARAAARKKAKEQK